MAACTRICFCPFFGMSWVILDEVAHLVGLLLCPCLSLRTLISCERSCCASVLLSPFVLLSCVCIAVCPCTRIAFRLPLCAFMMYHFKAVTLSFP